MKTATLLLVGSVALASAQIEIVDGVIKCPKPFGAYCVGNSLKTDIIARCDAAGVGRRGRCGDNLAGMPPIGNSIALCYQSSDVSGDAACEKNCVVYGGSGNGNGTFNLPKDVCVPTYTTSATTASETSTDTSSATSTSTEAETETTSSTTCTSGHGEPTVTLTFPPLTPTVPPTDTWKPLPPLTTTTTNLPTVPTAAAPAVQQAGVAMAAFGVAVACLL